MGCKRKEIFRFSNSISIESKLINTSQVPITEFVYSLYVNPIDIQSSLILDVDYCSHSKPTVSQVALAENLLRIDLQFSSMSLAINEPLTIHTRLHADNWANLDFTNDPTFDNSQSPQNRVSIRQNNIVAYGIEPAPSPVGGLQVYP